MHVRTDHWIVISTIFTSTKGQVDVYDTSYGEIDKSSRILIYSMFDEPVQINLIQDMQKQVGGVDCGVFSIAIATSLVHGQIQFLWYMINHCFVHIWFHALKNWL